MRLGANDRTRRPRIVVADDHPRLLASATAFLGSDFDVVAAVLDGRKALDASLRLNPDVAILDINMPELDGLQTARELKRAGSTAKIVVLTTDDLDAYVTAAIESGALGYVVKTRMFHDLPAAINHALAGRLFVPSLTSLPSDTHAIQFRLSDRASWEQSSQLLRTELQRGGVAAIVASDATRAGIAQQLIGWGCDLARAEEEGRYLSLNVDDALSSIMAGGRPDAARLAAMVEDLERRRLAAGPASRVAIVGEMSAVLCRDGNSDAAIELERTWHELTRPRRFLTVCPYPVTCFRDDSPELFAHICAAHSAASHAPGA